MNGLNGSEAREEVVRKQMQRSDWKLVKGLSRRWNDDINIDLKVIGCEFDSAGSGQTPLCGSCEEG